ncbi:sensor histidine kinase [Granulicatella seriolae]|uniref:histidine kinase n=1 Tax=Granulicatella seriolae TaxID=2967226 RepID=A0ABT1WQ46_9LACT|nr:sensor histidine kinase [Granulicatella seriolae]
MQKIEWLILGNYQHPLFSQEVWYENFLPFNLRRINASLQRLRVKLMDLSNEVQHLSSVPQYIGQETKEEILENERHRIARELHDSVSQQLFAAMMMLSAINEQKDSIPEKLQKQLTLVERIINESQSEMRALLLHLRPVSLENKSLKKGIEMLLKELMTKVQLEIHWELDDIHTKPGIEDHLFRIMQELLSNTLRHAKAKNLDVFLRQTPEWISLRVVDDGIGFDTNESRPGSYGLVNIRERVTGMGGTLKLLSFPNKGTIVEIKIPQITD